tara:strand:+ start:1549 stop:1695 length:147 start_codon:yes stop_codon:yes gene_type:complete
MHQLPAIPEENIQVAERGSEKFGEVTQRAVAQQKKTSWRITTRRFSTS